MRLFDDELPDDYPYDEMYRHSQVVDGVRMFPVACDCCREEPAAEGSGYCETCVEGLGVVWRYLVDGREVKL